MLQKMPKHFHVQLSISQKCIPPLWLLIPSWEFPQYQRVLYFCFIVFSMMTNSHEAQTSAKYDKLSEDERSILLNGFLCLPGLMPWLLREPACLSLEGGSVSVSCMVKKGHCLRCSMNVQGHYTCPCFSLHILAGLHLPGIGSTILP